MEHATLSFVAKPYSSTAKARKRAEGKTRDARFTLEPTVGDMTVHGPDDTPVVVIPTSIGPIRMILKYATIYGPDAPSDVAGITLEIREGTVTRKKAEKQPDAVSAAGSAVAVDHTVTQDRLIALGSPEMLADFLAETIPGVGPKKALVYAAKLIEAAN